MIKEVSNIIYVHLEKNDGGWSGDDIKMCAEEIITKTKPKLGEIIFTTQPHWNAKANEPCGYDIHIGEQYLGSTYALNNHPDFPNVYYFCPPNNHILNDCEFPIQTDKPFPENLAFLKESIEEDFEIFFKKYFES